MAFRLKAGESVRGGITRNVLRELDKALVHLSSENETEAVHEVRKCFKRVRAALRLVRDQLGAGIYREENWCLRDAARPLTEVRDAQMLIETLAKVTPRGASQPLSDDFARIHDALLAHQKEVARTVLAEDQALATVAQVARGALARVTDWQIEGDGWAALSGGLRRVYRTGRRTLALAAEDPSVANLHEWRKQAKYLWHQLQLLEPAWAPHEQDLGDQAHELSRLLGDDHDLAVLRQTLAADPLSYGGHRVLKAVFAFIDAARAELEGQAFALGRHLYADLPKVFTCRIESYWVTWPADVEAAKRPATSRSGRGRPTIVPRS